MSDSSLHKARLRLHVVVHPVAGLPQAVVAVDVAEPQAVAGQQVVDAARVRLVVELLVVARVAVARRRIRILPR